MRLTKVNGLNPNGSEWTPHFRELIKDVKVVGKKENATGTVFGILKDNYRNNKNIIQRDGIILDIDKSSKEVWQMLEQALEQDVDQRDNQAMTKLALSVVEKYKDKE